MFYAASHVKHKASVTPKLFSKRPSPFCENRKTGWGRARTCNFGNIMSLVRCQFVHTQFSTRSLRPYRVHCTFEASSDTVSTRSKPVRGHFKPVLRRSQYVQPHSQLILNSITSFTDRSSRSHYVLVSSPVRAKDNCSQVLARPLLFHRRTRASYVYNVCLAWYNVVLTHGSTQA